MKKTKSEKTEKANTISIQGEKKKSGKAWAKRSTPHRWGWEVSNPKKKYLLERSVKGKVSRLNRNYVFKKKGLKGNTGVADH